MGGNTDLFICHYMVEMVILSDGRVTTCCIDPMGVNSYASVNSDSFSEVVDKYLATRERLARDHASLPKCSECYSMFRQTGNPNMIFQATEEQVAAFIQQGRDFKKYRFVIEPTSKCNLKCKGCVQAGVNLSDYREKPFIDFDRLGQWIRPEMGKVGEIRFYNYGETFLHPKSLDFLLFLKSNNPDIRIEVATNGLLLDTPEKQSKLIQSGVDSVVFSIHGSNQENVEKYMTPVFRFSKLMEILEKLVRLKRSSGAKHPLLIWKYLLFEWNDSDENIYQARKRAQEIGVDEVWFEIAFHPAPSRRFKAGSAAWKKLTGDMRMISGITAAWDTKQVIPSTGLLRKWISKLGKTPASPGDK